MTDAETVRLDLTRDDFELVRTALKVLLSTLGREEAEELEQVRALLGRLESSRGFATSSEGG
jgi:hypothetical protein